MTLIFFRLKESTLIPLLLLITTIPVAHFGYQALSPTVRGLFSLAPYIVFTVAATLSLTYGRLRILMTLLVLVTAYWSYTTLLSTVGQSWNKFTIEMVFNAVTILGPINIALFSFWQERGSLVTDLPTKLMALGAQIFAIWLICEYQHQPTLYFLTQMLWPEIHPGWVNMAPIGFYSFCLSILAMLGLILWQPSTINAALFSALIILFIVSQQILVLGYLPVFMFLAGVLLVGVIIHETFNMAFKDDLTGLPGRRALNEQLAKLGRNYTIAMIDIDHFKKFNDTYGHDIGDQVLKMVAAKIRKVTGGGKAYRYGGEEFTVLFPNRDVQYALPHLEMIRQEIANYAMKVRDVSRPKDDKNGKDEHRKKKPDSPTVSVTISIGVAQKEGINKNPEQVVKAADDALYRAKHGGRNKVST